jgi:peptide/nickel transport system ATP-binding protein/oligopeptide transport system ATP-binding protein
MTADAPLLQVAGLVKHFPGRGGVVRRRSRQVHAVCGVSFDVGRGETLGLVGESGCGKSTTARLLLGLMPATAGTVRFGDIDVLKARSKALRALRRRLQMVAQDPYASLDPQMTVGASIAEPLRIHRLYRKNGRARVRELMHMVELDPEDVVRYPHQFSGGQRQRIGIARALALEPELLVLDEPISSLDVSIQAGVINLLADLQERLGVAYVFISHDLSVIRLLSHRVAVMYLGKLVETGTRDDVFRRPSHPYTQALLSAMPSVNLVTERARTRIVLPGDVPSPLDPPSGCRFRTRCWKAQEICAVEEPALVDRGQGHPVACHFAESPRSPEHPFGASSEPVAPAS